MKTILWILAVLVFTANTAEAYVRRTIGGGHVVRGAGAYSGRYAGGYGRGYYHRAVRGAAVAAGAAAVAATGWGGGYYGGYGTDDYYGAYAMTLSLRLLSITARMLLPPLLLLLLLLSLPTTAIMLLALSIMAATPIAATSPDGRRCFLATTGGNYCVDQIADAVRA